MTCEILRVWRRKRRKRRRRLTIEINDKEGREKRKKRDDEGRISSEMIPTEQNLSRLEFPLSKL
jgi:hypothetical protein